MKEGPSAPDWQAACVRKPDVLTGSDAAASADTPLARIAAALVGASLRRPRGVLAASLLLGVAALALVLGRFALDTDVMRLFAPGLPWKVAQEQLEEAFPAQRDRIVVVVDAATPDRAADAATALAAALAARPELFRSVLDPAGDPVLARSALLFPPLAEVAAATERLIAAQPLLGTLAADPSLRGVARVLDLLAQGGAGDAAAVEPALAALAVAAEAALAGRVAPVDWAALFTGRASDPEARRRVILLRPRPDFAVLAPIQGAIDAVRDAAAGLGLTPAAGVSVRLTGELVIEDEEFATVFGGAITENVLSLASVALLLWLGLRSGRLILPMLGVLVLGLVLTTAFALLVVGPFNPLSIAFAVLFIGLGVDFGIQYVVALRDARHRRADAPLGVALVAAARDAGPGIALAAGALAAGFLAFWPTDYRGVSELGVIAAAGMAIAVLTSLTTLPALLRFTHPLTEARGVGYAVLAPLDRWLTRRARLAGALALTVALVAGGSLYWLRFDTDPVNLRDPSSEAVATWRDLQRSPGASPTVAQVLAPDLLAAETLAARLRALPEVGAVRTLADLVPAEQDAKLALIADAALLIGPTLDGPVSTPADPPAIAAALAGAAVALGRAPEPAALRLAAALGRVASDPAASDRLAAAVLPGLRATLAGVRQALAAAPLTLATLPDVLRREWIAADGRARIEIDPASGADPVALRRFAAAVRQLAPVASGPAITVEASAATIRDAFIRAGLIAAVLIPALLLAALRSVRLVLLALAPLALAALLTGATCVAIGQPLNLANLVALPLLFAQGVAFDVYYVTAWMAGERALLPSALTRAVLYSALTNGTAFGTLALSAHPGTASLGLLLTVSLLWAMAAVLLTLPPLLALFAGGAPGGGSVRGGATPGVRGGVGAGAARS